jgi:exodeoxyribonuclease-3
MPQIVSYNVNGIRSAISKGLPEWLEANPFEVVCLQETKAQPGDFEPAPFEKLGYHTCWASAEKKGYSGVGILSKSKPLQVAQGTGMDAYDREGRFIRADFPTFSVLNCYFPSGTTGDARQAFKMEFLQDFSDYAARLLKEIPRLLIVGDFNIAHQEIDIHDPKGNKKTSGFLPEERAWMTQFFDSGFADAFRTCHPQEIKYSWWTFRAGARAKNKGWRIDYIAVADALKPTMEDAGILTDVVHADHCPVWVRINA